MNTWRGNRARRGRGRGRGEGDEEGADGTVFFAAKWQRARANRVGTSAATSQEESTREPPTSPRKAKGPSSIRHQQAVAALPGPVSYFVSFPSRSRAPLPPPLFLSLHPFPFILGPLQDFQFWQMARAAQKDHPFLFFLLPLRLRLFCKVSSIKPLARDKLVNWKHYASSERNGTYLERWGKGEGEGKGDKDERIFPLELKNLKILRPWFLWIKNSQVLKKFLVFCIYIWY